MFEIIVTCGQNSIIGTGRLADASTFRYFAALLTNRHPFFNEFLVYFVPQVSGYSDGFFRTRHVVSAAVSTNRIDVEVSTCYLKASSNADILHEFECSQKGMVKKGEINIKKASK